VFSAGHAGLYSQYGEVVLTANTTGQQGSIFVKYGAKAVAHSGSARIYLGNDGGGGDGMSIGYGALSGSSFGEGGNPSGVWISIDTHVNDQYSGHVSIIYNGSVVDQSQFFNGNAHTSTGIAGRGYHVLTWSVTEGGYFQYTHPAIGTRSAQLSGWSTSVQSDWEFGIGARTGAAYDEHAISDLTITDNKVAPTNISLSNSDVDENASSGTTVGSLSTTDSGGSNSFVYSLVSGTGATNNSQFQIVGDQLRTAIGLDYESGATRSVRVRTTDEAGLTFDKVFTITVRNVNDRPTNINLSTSTMAENAGPNAVIGTLSGIDPDGGDTLSMSLPSGLNDNNLFNISGTSLRANSSFDFESDPYHVVTVRVTDAAGLSLDRLFAIIVTNVNEVPTNISLSATLLSENAGTNAVIGTLSVTDTEAPALVKDISVGAPGAVPSFLTNVNGLLYFTASDGVNGTELWKSDLIAGAFLLKDIWSGGSSSVPMELTNVNGTLYFTADDGQAGRELWKSDGTAVGTVRVADIRTGGFASNPQNLTNVSGTLYFTADNGPNGRELWKAESNGAVSQVSDIRSGSASSNPGSLTNVNGTLYFTADNGSNGVELWKTATGPGAVMVSDIRSGSLSSSPGSLTTVNSVLYFTADNGTSGRELWKSDVGGTAIVKDVRTGATSSNPTNLMNMNGTLFLTADDGSSGQELWKGDIVSGAVLVKDVRAGGSGSSPGLLTQVGTTLYFTANDGVNGIELWKSDGSPGGTTLVSNIRAGISDSSPGSLTNVNGTLYFNADDGIGGRELWRSNGTASGTIIVNDIVLGIGSSNPIGLTNVNGSLFFNANDGVKGSELWRSPGDFFTFSLPAGLGSNSLFNISGTTLRANASFDFEAGSSYSITVRVTDSGGLTFDKPLVITVADVNEAPTDLLLSSTTVSENQASGTSVGTFSTTDPDAANTFTYSFATGSGDSDNASFTIDGDVLKTAVGFDYESKESHSIRVRYMDQGGLSQVKVFSITVSDVNEAPSFQVQRPGTTRQGNEFRVSSTASSSQTSSVIAMDPSGNSVVVWKGWLNDGSRENIFAQRFNASGIAVGSEILVNTYTESDQRDPTVAMDANGNFVVLWGSNEQDGSSDGVYGQRYAANGTPIGAEFRVNQTTDSFQGHPSVAMHSSGSFVVTWSSVDQDGSGVGIYGRRFGADGNAIGAEFIVNSFTSGHQSGSEIGVGSDGSFVITWNSENQDGSSWGIYAQRFDAAANPQGAEFRVNTFTAGYQLNPALAVESDGDFTIAWRSAGQDGSGDGIYAQRYAANGTAVGSEFRINTTTLNSQDEVSLAADSQGNLIAAWSSWHQDGSDRGIYAQIYSADGNPRGGEFRVNTFTNNPQRRAAIAVDADGDYLVVWDSEGQSWGGEVIYGQRYTGSRLVGEITTVAEDTLTTSRIKLGEFAIADDALGTESVTLTGANLLHFEVEGHSLYLKAGTPLDFESKNSYQVILNLDDPSTGNTPDDTISFSLTISNVNEAPTDLSLSNSSIAENLPGGTVIGTLTTMDPDAANTFAYSLVTGTGDADNGSFVIEGQEIKTVLPLDYEAEASYSIRVRSTDQGGLFFEKVFTITVTDIAEDVTAPVSLITAMAATSNSLSIPVAVTGSDPGAITTGVKEYDLYYSTGGSFIKFATVPAASPATTFTGSANTTYWFRSLGRDNAGNVETKTTSDTYTRIGDVVAPPTQVTSAVPNAGGLFTVQMTGAKVSGAALTVFDVYVSIDGNTPVLVGSANGVSLGSGNYSGQILFQGALDGVSHTYRFYSRGRDGAGNVEAAPVSGDVSVTHSFAAAGLTATAIDVQNGLWQRSYVRYLDVLFSSATGADALLNAGRVKVERFAIDAASVTPGTGVNVPGTVLAQNGNRLRLDFGATGLGGLRQAGNGFYRVLLDMDGNGSFADVGDNAFEFHRLFGDANGDAKVDIADTDLVTSQIGRTGSNLDGDLDGNNAVNSTDRLYTTQQRGKKLLDPLLGWLDD
jgi:ELWxxDGT repeat protein